MRYDFKSKSCFSGVFGYTVFALIGELGSDDATFLVSAAYIPGLASSHQVVLGVSLYCMSESELTFLQACVSTS